MSPPQLTIACDVCKCECSPINAMATPYKWRARGGGPPPGRHTEVFDVTRRSITTCGAASCGQIAERWSSAHPNPADDNEYMADGSPNRRRRPQP